MKIGIVGRGSLGTALGISAESAEHEVCLFRRKIASLYFKDQEREGCSESK